MANRISAELKQADADAVLLKLSEVKDSLPFLQDIDKTERIKGQKIGQASLGYVQECVNAAVTNDEVLPRNFSTEEFQRDLALYMALAPLASKLDELAQKVNDTLLVVGKDLMENANIVYERVKSDAKKNNSRKPLADQLGEFYKRSKRGEATPAAPGA